MDLHGLWSRLTGARPGSPPEASSDTAGHEAAPHVARGTPAWRRLPPIAPTAHAAPLVAQRSPFEPGLGGAAHTPLALAPLGHERSLEAPAGLVTAVHAPVVARAADPVPASVRPPGRGRRHEHGAAASASWPANEEPASAAPFTEAAPAPAVDVPLVRPAPVVARSVDETPLTVAPAVQAPGGFVGRMPIASPVAASSPPRAASTGPGTSDADLHAAAPADAPPETVPLAPPFVPGLPDVAVARSAVDAAAVSPPSMPLVARRNLGQSRRLRIGPALEPTAGPAAASRPGPIFQRSVESTPDPMPQFPPDAPLERGFEPATEAASAGLSVARSVMPHAADHAGHDAEPRGATLATDAEVSGEPGPSPTPVALRTVAADRPEIAPLLGTLRPVFDSASPAVAIARAPAEDDDDAAPAGVAAALAALNGPGGGLPAPEGSQTVARLPDTWSGPAARRDPEPGNRGGFGGRGGRGGLPGASTGSGGRPVAGGAPSGGSTASRSASTPYVARTIASPAADRPGDAVTRLSPAPGVAFAGTARLRVGGAVAASVARSVEPAASGSVTTSTFQTVAAGPSVAPSAGDASPATVLRAVADPGVPALGEETATSGTGGSQIAGVQRAAEGASAPAAPAGPAGGSAAGAGPASGPELDALAARLYERIRLRLRRELLADRERAGVLVDLGR